MIKLKDTGSFGYILVGPSLAPLTPERSVYVARPGLSMTSFLPQRRLRFTLPAKGKTAPKGNHLNNRWERVGLEANEEEPRPAVRSNKLTRCN